MPRWRALPQELDPEVREFTEQLRRIVERSGMGLGAVADRTGYSKTSWERYLNGRLLPPLGAVEALAGATGVDPGHLGTMWELADRAWSRSELRHDVTVEALRVAQARAALGEFGPPPAPAPAPSEPLCQSVPAPSPLPSSDGVRVVSAAEAPVPRSAQPPDYRAEAIPIGPSGGDGAGGRPPRRRAALFVTGVVGALLVVAAAVLLLGVGDKDHGSAAPSAPQPGTSAPSALPAGVKCAGDACAGKDPEAMGCGGDRATTAGSATVGTSYVEVRYSEVCGAAWGRITRAGAGDAVRINAKAHGASPARSEAGRVGSAAGHAADGYTPMVAVTAPGQATACASLTSGAKGCTVPRKV
ncbi:XRE family transcriptional regulator [Streptomyces sp. UNOC14_S4]|uniref:helix-turn-helix domain-containing protein n=1 Tax=Streptomyces sp. UNOC14_S4 TaxID=2872340 RepID=UPI001E459330|nr:XRE family transcriptional regulator [Streptomyces sp. UNOC14_S4]MCC3771140.1 XRE family transcriptional regulator [Streptomyces sp. UNOC14_S4]